MTCLFFFFFFFVLFLLATINLFFFFFKNTKYFITHKYGEREEGFKKINNGVYPKKSNS